MNLKEAFRYQNFLNGLMTGAATVLNNRGVIMSVTKTHHRKAANPEAEDLVEDPQPADYAPGQVLDLMSALVAERMKLSAAITAAKADKDLDLDAAQETNRFRHQMASAMRSMLGVKPSLGQQVETSYKLTADGNQVPYKYQVDVQAQDNFDRAAVKAQLKALLKTADEESARIDNFLVTTQVAYEPPFSINDDFDEVLATVVKAHDEAATET